MLKDIVEEINNVKFYSVLADEVTSRNNEVLAICLRFFDKYKNIRKAFVGFLPLKQISGIYIAETIKVELELNNILIQENNAVSNIVASMLEFREQ